MYLDHLEGLDTMKTCSKVLLIISVGIFLASCNRGSSSSSPLPRTDVTVSWDANRETAVNSPGGGYKVYSSTISGFNISDSGVSVVDAPYVSGALAPTSASVPLVKGATNYIRIAAYSALNPPGSSDGSQSLASNQISIAVP